MAIRVYLANEHDIIREGLKNILSRNPIINIAGEFTGNGELFSNVDRIKPNLLFIDISTKDDKTLKNYIIGLSDKLDLLIDKEKYMNEHECVVNNEVKEKINVQMMSLGMHRN